jgi:hypothetical protein
VIPLLFTSNAALQATDEETRLLAIKEAWEMLQVGNSGTCTVYLYVRYS